MSQHFLLSAKARTLSVRQITKLSEQEAHDLLKTIRWGHRDEDMVCPHCGTVHAPYKISTRNQYRCKHCQHTFSVTSGTIFANHKLPISVYLLAIVLFVNALKGISPLQLAHELIVKDKTAFVFAVMLN